MSIDFLKRVLGEAATVAGITQVGLHWRGADTRASQTFQELIETCGMAGIKTSFVTNGWHFDKLWPPLGPAGPVLSHIFIQYGWRHARNARPLGEARDLLSDDPGVFRDVIGQPAIHDSRRRFVAITDRGTSKKLLFSSAAWGAAGLNFSHILPTSEGVECQTRPECRRAQTCRGVKSRCWLASFKMEVGIDVATTMSTQRAVFASGGG